MTETQAEFRRLLRATFADVPAAADMILGYCSATETWDNIVDGDEVDKGDADANFRWLWQELPVNPFFLQYRESIIAQTSLAIDAWDFSDKAPEARIKAFDICTELSALCLYLIGGPARVRRDSPKIREGVLALLRENDKKD